ncbi:RES domain-containing protein [Malaciobacter sp. WC5094]
MANCCSNCFNDKFIKDKIEYLSKKSGRCYYCESKNVKVIDAESLIDFFEELLDLYDIHENGILLSELLDSDWKMFDLHRVVANNLLADILSDNKILSSKYINTIEKTSDDVWDKFKKELKYKNRYFPNDEGFDRYRLKEISQYFEALEYPVEVFRARISKDGNMIHQNRMGKPPSGQLTQGRANPVGISYLYVASDKKTAVSEIRPDKGDIVTISKIKLPQNLRFFDIRSPKNTISPFDFSDNVLEALYKDIDLLENFGEELSKPVLPREAGIEYLSSQYLSELIKHWGFDGMLYKSSVGNGFNMVIFSDIELSFEETKLYSINSLCIDFSTL